MWFDSSGKVIWNNINSYEKPISAVIQVKKVVTWVMQCSDPSYEQAMIRLKHDRGKLEFHDSSHEQVVIRVTWFHDSNYNL